MGGGTKRFSPTSIIQPCITMKFTYFNTTYEILDIIDRCDERDNRNQIILNDFNYCFEVGDHSTIRNRISQGLEWGWLKQI